MGVKGTRFRLWKVSVLAVIGSDVKGPKTTNEDNTSITAEDLAWLASQDLVSA
jgi:hypothetical protein